mmetsp:Transcript_46591/g.76070  ORF Transcript_46591/g.76070 Transcript_46591/m.76070 type:complete len:142 (+) Transcript_46591:478-903(+)
MREDLFHMIKGMQNAINVVETCPVPVIAVIQGVCIGAAVDLIAACDMRYCSDDASFAIKEVVCASVYVVMLLWWGIAKACAVWSCIFRTLELLQIWEFYSGIPRSCLAENFGSLHSQQIQSMDKKQRERNWWTSVCLQERR